MHIQGALPEPHGRLGRGGAHGADVVPLPAMPRVAPDEQEGDPGRTGPRREGGAMRALAIAAALLAAGVATLLREYGRWS